MIPFKSQSTKKTQLPTLLTADYPPVSTKHDVNAETNEMAACMRITLVLTSSSSRP